MKNNCISSIILGVLLLFCSNAFAQQRMLQVVKNGEVVFAIPAEDIDYMSAEKILTAPTNVNGVGSNGIVFVSWDAVSSATSYNIFRSSDNINFALVGSSYTASFLDSAPLNGTNYYRVQAVAADGQSAMSESSPAITVNSSDVESGIYLGITGFNQQLYSYPITHLTGGNKLDFNYFIDGLTTKNGTILYYSVDQAITSLLSNQYPEDLFNVAIVTFTDGLDQGSFMKDDRYSTVDEYLNAVNSRIKNDAVAGVPITAYSIGVRGTDVTDVAQFQNNLQKLASSTTNAMEVSNMSQVNDKFKEIAQQLVESNIVQSIELNMPGLANGTKVRFTFDNVSSAASSKLYIEGVFNLANKSLTNVVYKGLSSTAGSTVQGTVNGIFVKFTFDGVRTDSKTAIAKTYTKEWTYVTSTSSWQINSEFDKDENSEIETIRKSAAIMLVLDCSSSLGNDFVQMKLNAKDFIATLLEEETSGSGNTGNGNEGNTPPSQNTLPFSTTPIDLSLAVVSNGVRYYMTKAEYNQYGVSNYLVEGVCVVVGAESFIVAMNNVSANQTVRSAAVAMYPNQLPTQGQAIAISARMNEINQALSAFGGTTLGISSHYHTSYTSGSYCYEIYGTSGSLDGWHSSSNHTANIRPVIKTNSNPSVATNDLKLKIVKNATYKHLAQYEYKQSGVPAGYTAVGVTVVVPGVPEFTIEMNDKTSTQIARNSAVQLYNNYLPNQKESMTISARMSEINQALSAFGGTTLGTSNHYHTSYTSDSYCYEIYGTSGSLGGWHSSFNHEAYVRGVIR